MMVELFCGLLSGGAYGPGVRRWMDTTREADLGQCFVALDPAFFAPGFEGRLSDLMDTCRGMAPAEDGKPVLAAGDPERAHLGKVAQQGGVTYHTNQVTGSWRLAQHLEVAPCRPSRVWRLAQHLGVAPCRPSMVWRLAQHLGVAPCRPSRVWRLAQHLGVAP